jgi:SAM-dependent methyltransferase
MVAPDREDTVVRGKEIRKAVREGYAKIAKHEGGCCVPVDSCCGGTDLAQEIGRKIGYSEEELKAVPDGANIGLGCGNPIALASLKAGETVLDLGSGPGLDCFLASNRVGETGKVIGVDMTPEMIDKARRNAEQGGYDNVEFRLGEIENLPLADSSVDIVISNCVINLAPDKNRVFREAFRVLRPGGRMMISDLVLLEDLPGSVRDSIAAYVGCLSGAMLRDEYLQVIDVAGFTKIEVLKEASFPIDCMANDPQGRAFMEELGITQEESERVWKSVVSIEVRAEKAGGAQGRME